MQWFSKSKYAKGVVESDQHLTANEGSRPRLAIAHFMLGNTYPFVEKDWLRTFDLVQDTGLDALALNIGPEEWQFAQACTAYRLISTSTYDIKLFLSLDLMVLPKDPKLIFDMVVQIIQSGPSAQLRWDDKLLLSTFGGHELGDEGWKEVLRGIEKTLSEKVFFIPSFFLPPEEILKKDYVDGAYHWNGAWPMDNSTINLDSDQPFLNHEKPYMASVSPLFFTHYGTEGDWAFNKNWIYRSDDLLLPTRFSQLLSLPINKSPEMIQVISWNDFGESHYIGPILGAQPGSENWTNGMIHEGFRLITKYYIKQWKDQIIVKGKNGDGDKAKHEEKAKLIIWYRIQSKEMSLTEDKVAKPNHSEWAQDLLNFFIILPESKYSLKDQYNLYIKNDDQTSKAYSLNVGKPNLINQYFKLGKVEFKIMKNNQEIIIEGKGIDIIQGGNWNYNMWTGIFDAI
ncbi:uncharacterized protein I206_104760 [Kwoniella pini CBS 10737]|uniref:Glucan endo-1,3-alpha-glucosidase agn1 n=1 Tax=Kwoniella pini CBS 10737 TaxID=1296096 RepID=A0A1B9I7V4_9TREE|nr:uncharacterized protein I206_02298 [Kwoniella pini CBS 10737]OCF51583.1 hypothetical protein I206_02298 [Kwoniella pini CBS 10737]